MRRLGFLAAALLALAATALPGHGLSGGRQPHVALAATASLAIEECIEVEEGDTFSVAITVAGVTNLLAWDIYYAYDRNVVEVVGRDVRQFLDKEPNSNVFDLSDPVPNTNGVYRAGAADTGGPGTEEDGSGVLAVLTLRARSEGLSWSSLLRIDGDNDGNYDFGSTLTETGGGHIGDTNGDGVFDGAIAAGQIAVGRGCKDPAPTPFVEDGSIIVNPTITTPGLTSPTPAPTRRPDGSTPEPDDLNATPTSSSPSGTGVFTLASPRSPTPAGRGGSPPGNGGDGSGGGLSPLLAGAAAVIGGLGFTASYFLFRAARRPA